MKSPNPLMTRLLCMYLFTGLATQALAKGLPEPLVIGETFTLESKTLDETRRINIFLPPGYARQPNRYFPVLYMPDGGIKEDFLHIVGLVHVSTINGTMRPMIVVGIENTERRRDLTGPTEVEKDKEIAPRVGGSAAFRAFVRDELMPLIRTTYRTTDEAAIVGESLAGLFVVETLLLEPAMFDTYIAVDPSLWWNDQYLVNNVEKLLKQHPDNHKRLFLAAGQGEIAPITKRLAGNLRKWAGKQIQGLYLHMPREQHHTIYHPAALKAFRQLFAPPAQMTTEATDSPATGAGS